MAWHDGILDSLSRDDHWGYRVGEHRATEPLALAALALIGHGRHAVATKLLEALCDLQDNTGAVGIYPGAGAPHWGTAHAVLAWSAALEGSHFAPNLRDRFRAAAVQGCKFILSVAGKTIRPEDAKDDISHNTMLVGWPWVEGTHSWLEPTAVCSLALRATRKYPELETTRIESIGREAEAVRLMIDRILPAGGCNYGNTFVLGQLLRPHLQPTGIVLLALAGATVPEKEERIVKSLAWVEGAINAGTTTASLAYGLLGLAAHDRERTDASDLLDKSLNKPTSSLGAYLPRRSLAALATLGKNSPLITVGREGAAR